MPQLLELGIHDPIPPQIERPAGGRADASRSGRAVPQVGRGRRVALLAVHHVRVDGQTLTGGAEKYIQQAIEALLRVGTRVHVGYSGDSIYDELLAAHGPNELTVERTGWLDENLSGDARLDLGVFLQRRRWLRAVHADTVFAVQQASGGAFVNSLLAAKSLRLRVVTSIRQMPETPAEAAPRLKGMLPAPRLWQRRPVWRRRIPAWCADAMIFNSRRVAEGYARQYGFSRDRCCVIRNGETALGAVQTPAARALRIAAVGRVTAAKGADTLFDAFSIVARRNPAARLTYYGDGPLVPILQARARNSGLAERVRFAGYLSDRARIYDEVDICVQASRRESMANSVIEAMARGIPCIVSNVGGLPEMLVDEASGLVVPPEDARKLAEALARLLTDSDLYSRIRSAAARRARSLFDPYEFQRATVAAILG
ncbi:MAG TPA: glycosyltransferase [Phycisphaerae bacterium]|nr:glycosyltransferase [Phycisphaerae bacterium]